MKKSSKEKILYWGVKTQIKSRPNKNAQGMSFTNERRARIKNKSIFYHAIITNNKCTDEARTLSVRGTLDKLASTNSVKSYNFNRYKNRLSQQKSGVSKYNHLKELIF